MMTYIDLTHIITDGMPAFPGDLPIRLQPITTYQLNGVANHLLYGSVHMGTHIDAPGHFTDSDKKITDFPLSKFMGRAILIDVHNIREIGISTIFDKVERDDIVLFYTGFDKQFYNSSYFLDYPVITQECAEYLVAAKVKMVGIDFPSVDKAPYDIHKILLGNDILIIENLTNLQKLQGYGDIELIALPLKLDAHGAPARVIAVVK